MSIGNRIRYIRKLRGITQRELGLAVGFSEKTAEIRISQYETGMRTPRSGKIKDISAVLDVSPQILSVPEIIDEIGLFCTFFALEDSYGLQIKKNGEDFYLAFDCHDNEYTDFQNMLCAWLMQSKKLQTGEISREEYDRWRYNFTFQKMI